MKVLVVDDNVDKVAQVTLLLTSVGFANAEIESAATAAKARKMLATTTYDLLILDIAIPIQNGGVIDRLGGVKLLDELVGRDPYRLPQSIVGLTAYDDLFSEFDGKFRSKLWTLDKYDSADTGWKERLRAKGRYIVSRAKQARETKHETDLCVITALHSPELTALRARPWAWEDPVSLDEVNFYYRGHLVAGETSNSVVAAAAPRMGMVSAALLSAKMIAQFHPRVLAMSGIAAGIKDRCEIGDVIVADPCWEWQFGKYEAGKFTLGADQIDIPVEIRQRCVQLGDDEQFWFDVHREYQGAKPSNLPKLRIGPVASGSAVLSDEARVSSIKEQHRKLLGIEMEIYGAYAAARDSAPPHPMTFSMKSVCDYADASKSDQFQGYAAYVSACALQAFAERYLHEFRR